MLPVAVFDVNETLLSLDPVRVWFEDRFDGSVDATAWFRELLRLSFVSATTDSYTPFPVLAGHALTTVAATNGVSEDDIESVSGLFTQIPAHPDVASGLESLRQADIETAALTNSPLATAEQQLTNAGIRGHFDTVMSVEMVERFKPHSSVYQAAADRLGVPIGSIVMVAAHDWDIAGAKHAGARGIYINRGGTPYSSAFPSPDATVPDIPEASRWIIDQSSSDNPKI